MNCFTERSVDNFIINVKAYYLDNNSNSFEELIKYLGIDQYKFDELMKNDGFKQIIEAQTWKP